MPRSEEIPPQASRASFVGPRALQATPDASIALRHSALVHLRHTLTPRHRMGNSCSGKPAAVPRETPAPRRRRTTSPLADARLSIAGGRPSVATKRMSDVSELTESDVSEQS